MSNQIPLISQALANHTPMMIPILVLATTQALMVYPGAPISKLPLTQVLFLQSYKPTLAKTGDDRGDIRELAEQMKKLTVEVIHLRNHNTYL